MTGTGTSNFSQAKIDAYIRKKTLEFGGRKYVWRKHVNKERIEAGNGITWKAIRYLNLDVPLAGLTEGVAPTETDMAVETVLCTATQYGITVKITDILQLTIASQPLQKAIQKKAEVMASLDDQLIAGAALAGTNVFYGGTASARSGLSATGGDVLTTTILRKMVANLRSTDGVKGAAPTMSNGYYVGLIHSKQVFDVQKDATWEGAAIRNEKMLADLKSGAINLWAGTLWYESDFLPVFKNLFNGNAGGASLDIADNTAVAGTYGMNGFKSVSSAGGSLTASKFWAVKCTRKHKKRGFEEGISSIFSVPTNAAQGTLTFTMPADTSYVYQVYFDSTAGGSASGAAARGVLNTALFRVAQNQAAAAAVVVTAVTTSANGPIPPVNPPQCTTSTTDVLNDTFTAWALGGDAVAVVDLQDMESYLVRGPDSSNPLNQFVLVGSKFSAGQCILQDAYMARLESQSAFNS
jgi:N4-gp56 family major capsid protein